MAIYHRSIRRASLKRNKAQIVQSLLESGKFLLLGWQTPLGEYPIFHYLPNRSKPILL